MKVKAADGLRVPMEDKPRDYIEGVEEFDVPDTPYYHRRIADGDLVAVKATRSAKPTSAGGK